MRAVECLDAPSNLGLRPPKPGAAPGVAKLATALWARGLLEKIGASDGGRLTPPDHSPDLGAALGTLLADPRAVGMDLTIYDPELDPDGVYGDRLTQMIVRAFRGDIVQR